MANTHRDLGDGAWVEFKASGYPFKLRKQLKAATDDESVIDILVPFIEKCSIPVIGGETLERITGIDDLANVEEKTTAQLIYAFYDFRGERLSEPIAKNN